MIAPPPRDFRRDLRTQLSFIERSCTHMDEGHLEECLRIAVAARVIFHHTGKSKSLLHYLQAEAVSLYATNGRDRPGPNQPPGMTLLTVTGLGMFGIGPSGANYIPKLGDGMPGEFLPFAEWWGQRIMMVGKGITITRRSLVLAAANKDNGAHVDVDNPDAGYEAVRQSFGGFDLEQPIPTEAQHTHAVDLRQIGWEILNSPDLVALAGPR